MNKSLIALLVAAIAVVSAMPRDQTATIKYLEEEIIVDGVYNGPVLNATTGVSKGVDISQLIPTSNYNCMHNSGYTFAIPRAYRSSGSPDPNACSTIKNAHAGGLKYVDVYIFPCPTCGTSGASQISSMVNALKSAGCGQTSGSQGGSQWGQIWLDIEGTQYWSTQSANENFYNSMVSECKTLGIPWGTYSSSSQWNPIMGSGFTGGSGGPLWWASWTGTACTATMSSFGGWSSYNMQQYVGDTTFCSTSVDLDCY
jgi:hypothetical protein